MNSTCSEVDTLPHRRTQRDGDCCTSQHNATPLAPHQRATHFPCTMQQCGFLFSSFSSPLREMVLRSIASMAAAKGCRNYNCCCGCCGCLAAVNNNCNNQALAHRKQLFLWVGTDNCKSRLSPQCSLQASNTYTHSAARGVSPGGLWRTRFAGTAGSRRSGFGAAILVVLIVRSCSVFGASNDCEN